MTDTSKTIPIKQFREQGYLQELNRQFLHPLGLAMAVEVHDDGIETLGYVLDSRDDPEGFIYGDDVMDSRKADAISIAQKVSKDKREKLLGYWIQPVIEEIDE